MLGVRQADSLAFIAIGGGRRVGRSVAVESAREAIQWRVCGKPEGTVRIALLIDELAPTGGTEAQIRLLLRSFDRERLEPTLVLLRGPLPLPAETGDCPVEHLGMERLRSYGALSHASALGRRVRAGEIELIWAFFPDASLVGWWVARRIGVPLVLNQRNVGAHREHPWLGDPLDRFVMRRADGCVANSEAARRYAEGRRVRRDRLVVIPNAVDTQRFQPIEMSERRRLRGALGLPLDGLVVGCVANQRPVKGIADLVRAFASLRERHDATLVLVGDGEQRPALESLARTLGVEREVSFLGQRTDIERIAPCFDVGVLPSHAEGSSNALLELLSCGTPTIATDVGGNPEALRGGELGLLVPPRDPQALAGALNRLLGDPDGRRALADRGRAHVVAHFGPAEITPRWERVFRDVIARRAG